MKRDPVAEIGALMRQVQSSIEALRVTEEIRGVAVTVNNKHRILRVTVVDAQSDPTALALTVAEAHTVACVAVDAEVDRLTARIANHPLTSRLSEIATGSSSPPHQVVASTGSQAVTAGNQTASANTPIPDDASDEPEYELTWLEERGGTIYEKPYC